MIQAFRRLLVTALILFTVVPNVQAFQESAPEESGAPIDVVGKVQDHHYFTLFGAEIPLPRIIFLEGEVLPDFYVTTASAVESGRYIENADNTLVPADGSNIALDMSITSHLVWFWIGVVLTLVLTIAMARKYSRGAGRETEPQGWFQNLFEITFVFVRDEIAKTNIPDEKYKKFVPYLFSVFVAITFMNLFGLLPWGATATADITVTGVLAFFTFVITQWNGSKDHWAHVFWFPGVHNACNIDAHRVPRAVYQAAGTGCSSFCQHAFGQNNDYLYLGSCLYFCGTVWKFCRRGNWIFGLGSANRDALYFESFYWGIAGLYLHPAFGCVYWNGGRRAWAP